MSSGELPLPHDATKAAGWSGAAVAGCMARDGAPGAGRALATDVTRLAVQDCGVHSRSRGDVSGPHNIEISCEGRINDARAVRHGAHCAVRNDAPRAPYCPFVSFIDEMDSSCN